MCSQIKAFTRFSPTSVDVTWFQRTSLACENLVIAFSHVLRERVCSIINAITRFSHTSLDVAWFESTSVICENLVRAFSHVLPEIQSALQ